MMPSRKIRGKIVLKGTLECCSPLHIGCGGGQRSDLDVLLDEEKKPFIPATSLIGALRSHIRPDNVPLSQLKQFWGYTDREEGRQSSIRCFDLCCLSQKQHIVIRDGIKIDSKNGIVQEQAKYDYEIVNPGTQFALTMELTYTHENYAFVRRMAATIVTELMKQHIHIQLGAKTSSGLGQMQLLNDATAQIYEFDFAPPKNDEPYRKADSHKSAVANWLRCRSLRDELPEEQSIPVTRLGTPFTLQTNVFSIAADFRIKNSLIVRSYSSDPKAPDATHITSGKDWVLPGTSLKGAIRARAERILNTLDKPTKGIIKDLFGFVNEDERKARKGRIRIEEIPITGMTAEQQTRIKIDRFTGGTIESALFDTMPLFKKHDDSDDSKEHLRVTMQIHGYDEEKHKHEAGLLLLILKDLWTGDLAVGGEKNVGRGVLEGLKATICSDKSESITLERDLSVTPENGKERLAAYVEALNNYKHE